MDFGMPVLLETPKLADCAALCGALDLQFIELNQNFPWFRTEALKLPELKALSQQYGIYYTLHLEEEISPCNLNPLVARAYTDTALGAIDLAKALGAPTITMHLNRGVYITLPDKKVFLYETCREEYLRHWAAFRDMCTERIGDSPLRLCVENTNGWDQPYLKDTVALLLESPRFALTLDTGHSHCQGGSDESWMLERKDRLTHLHLHDAAGKACHLPLGTGALDIPAYIGLARELQCRAVLEIKTVEALGASVNYLRQKGLR